MRYVLIATAVLLCLTGCSKPVARPTEAPAAGDVMSTTGANSPIMPNNTGTVTITSTEGIETLRTEAAQKKIHWKVLHYPQDAHSLTEFCGRAWRGEFHGWNPSWWECAPSEDELARKLLADIRSGEYNTGHDIPNVEVDRSQP